ncbi:MAG TPA: hypothetical protein VF314_13050 [Actinomycetes bacterium]
MSAPAAVPSAPAVETGAARRRRPAYERMPLMALGLVGLLCGLVGGLALLGLGVPTRPAFAAQHGALMALGFLGTLISLERAVALGHRWGYAAPALAGAGGVALAAGLPPAVGRLLLAVAAAWLVAIYVSLWQVQPAAHLLVQALGALAWWGAALRWLGGAALPEVVTWLAAFLVLTIAGERLELARVAFLDDRVRRVLLAVVATVCAGLGVGLLRPDLGARVVGVGLLALAAWLARHDVARHTVRATGVTRFMAVCLLAGYVWLGVAGTLWAAFGAVTDGGRYDATLHAVFLGFVMSMVMGHAPVIVPAVLRVRLPHHPVGYLPVAVLHASVALRLAGGDALGVHVLRQAGGVGNVAALLLFVIVSAVAVGRGGKP